MQVELEAEPVVQLVAETAEDEARLRGWLDRTPVQTRLASVLLAAFEALEEVA